MEVNYTEKTIEDAIAFLESIGEDPNDYSDKQLTNMLKEGF
jgi:hypothetical protein